MRSLRFSWACISALLWIVVLTTVTAVAKDGRDFAGFYSLSQTKIHGDHVQVTLHVQVHNNGDADVSHAIITLRQNTGHELVGTSKPINLLRLHDHVNLSQQFVVSRIEYESWRQGSQPELSIIYRAKGKTWERSIQVSPKNGI